MWKGAVGVNGPGSMGFRPPEDGCLAYPSNLQIQQGRKRAQDWSEARMAQEEMPEETANPLSDA